MGSLVIFLDSWIFYRVQISQSTKNLDARGDVHGSTPLHVATWQGWQGRTKVVRELLKAGANVREVNQDGTKGYCMCCIVEIHHI